jgi:Flp pilus assembly protein TadG
VPQDSKERGQTIVLVAISLVALLAMAALAIDVVTLYVARGEAQRAADAAALAGAKAFVDSGVTSDPGNLTRKALAQTMANAYINGILPQNKVVGVQPVLTSVPLPDFSQDGNPKITVTLQRANLPIFFARIWGTSLATVTATATAEAYNPSNSQTITGNFISIAPKCVKPFLIPNKDPANPGAPLIDAATGAVNSSVLGETFDLKAGCQGGNPNNPCVDIGSDIDPQEGQFIPAVVTPDTNNLCPSCQGSSNFEQSIECCVVRVYDYDRCGTSGLKAPVDITIIKKDVHQDAQNGISCLINQPSQDTLDPASVTNFGAGTAPLEITATAGPHSGQLVTTSNSIVSFPVFNDPPSIPAGTSEVTIIGFLQAFIQNVNSTGNVSATVTILNVVGCGNSPGSTPAVSGGGSTPIPVRLIHN